MEQIKVAMRAIKGNYHQGKSKAEARDRAVSWANCLERTSTTLILRNRAILPRDTAVAILPRDTAVATLLRDTAVATLPRDTAEGTRSSHQEEGGWARWELVLLVWGVDFLVVYCWPMHLMEVAMEEVMMEGVVETVAETVVVETSSGQTTNTKSSLPYR